MECHNYSPIKSSPKAVAIHYGQDAGYLQPLKVNSATEGVRFRQTLNRQTPTRSSALHVTSCIALLHLSDSMLRKDAWLLHLTGDTSCKREVLPGACGRHLQGLQQLRDQTARPQQPACAWHGQGLQVRHAAVSHRSSYYHKRYMAASIARCEIVLQINTTGCQCSLST